MQFQGYSVDNLHRGDVRITKDLEVDGNMEIKGDVVYTGDVKIEPPNCLSTDCINSTTPATGIEINTEYKLPIVKGTIDQVLTQVDALGNCEFKDAGGGTGTARVITNKYYMVTPQPNTAWAYNTYQTIDSVGNGSKVIQADDFPTFAQIRIKAFGTWNITSTSPQVSPKGVLRLTFGTIQIELDDILIATLYTGSQNLNYVGGFNWNIYITRFSATLIKIAFTNETGTTIGPYYYVAPEHLSQSFDQYSLPTFPANIELEWKNTSALTTDPEIYPITGGYSIDIMNPTTDILTSTSSPATDHLTLANLNAGALGDGGHVNAFLINGIKPMTGDLKMNSNSIENCPLLFSGGPMNLECGAGGDLSLVSGTIGGDLKLSAPGGAIDCLSTLNMNNNNIINTNEITKTTPSGGNLEVKNNDGALVLSGQGLLGNIQLITPNNIIANCTLFESLAVYNDFLNGNINMNNNNIINPSVISNTASMELNATADLRLVGDTVDLAATNAITHAIGATPKLTIDAVETTSFTDLNMDNNNITNVATINGISAVGGVFTGTASSLLNNPSVGGTIEVSLLPTTFIGSVSVPANAFQISSYHLVVAGSFGANNGDTLTLRLKGGATSTTILATLVVPLNNASGFFECEVDFQLRATGGPGAADVCSNFDFTYNQSGGGGGFQGERGVFQNNTTFDTTTLNTLEITGQFSSANASNNIQSEVQRLTRTY